jgi:hypothetical protein
MAVRIAPELGTPAGRYIATEAGALLYRLIAHDDLWTAELGRASGQGSLSENEIQALGDLVAEMRRDLEEVPDRAYEVRLMLDEATDEDVDGVFATIAEHPWASPSLGSLMEGELPDYELRSASIAACEYLRKMARSEARILDEKLSAIVESGEVPDGDYKLPFRCAALLALVGVGVAASIGLGGAPLFVGMATVNQVGLGALGWVGSKCPPLLPEISFGRRG